jgi:hypothetical protein
MWWLVAGGLALALLIALARPASGRAESRSPVLARERQRVVAPAERLEVIDLEAEGELEDAIRAQYRKKQAYYRLHLASGQPFAVGHSPGDDWLDVIARKRRKGEKGGEYAGPYGDYGYSVVEGRWSYGEAPPGATEVREAMAGAFGAKRRGRWS